MPKSKRQLIDENEYLWTRLEKIMDIVETVLERREPRKRKQKAKRATTSGGGAK